MLQIHNLHKSYGIATVLANISFVVNDGEHIGLVSPNGIGKSTLLRCIVGQETPDAGSITHAPPDATLGYLPQAFADAGNQTVGQVVAGAQAAWHAAAATVQHAADAMADTADMDAAMSDYDAALARFEALGGYERETHAAAVLSGLALGELAPATPVATLSGGQKTRLGLATLLLGEPDLLLLDEPTNHLDVAALEWLEGFVQRYSGAVLIVSHDRTFLDATATRILYLDPLTRAITSYTGNYSAFAAARAHERELHAEAWQKQQEYVGKVSEDIARLKGQALGVEAASTPKNSDAKFFLSGKGGSKKVAKKAKSRERKLDRYMESDERVEKPKQSWGLKLDFGAPPDGGRAVLRVEDVSFGYLTNDEERMTNDHPPSSFVIRHSSFDVDYGERIAIVGPNGAGKTTLLRLLAGQLAPQAGQVRLGANVRLGVMSQEQETLPLDQTVLEAVRRERAMSETDARNFLHFFLFAGDSVFRPVGACSLGERSRLQLARLVLGGCNLLLLDEPLNHLDIEGREHFEQALEAFEGTVIAVAHDRAFLRRFAARVIAVRDGTAQSFAGDYAAYERGVAGER